MGAQRQYEERSVADAAGAQRRLSTARRWARSVEKRIVEERSDVKEESSNGSARKRIDRITATMTLMGAR